SCPTGGGCRSGSGRRCRTRRRIRGSGPSRRPHPRTHDIVPLMSAAARLAEFVVKTSLEDCPSEAVARVRRAALDTLGVMLAGAGEPVAHIVRRVVRAEGGIALAAVVGTALKTAPGWGAAANGGAHHGARPRPDAPRARHRRLPRLRAQGEFRLDDEALSRRPRGAERDSRRPARA